MARVSFSLRRHPANAGELVGVGSFNRGTSTLQVTAGAAAVDQDSALRADGIIIDIPASAESSFEARAINYNNVELTWTLTEAFTDIANVLPAETKLISVALVYSPNGAPETVQDGTLIYQGTDFIYSHQSSYTVVTDQGNETVYVPPSGRWAYYSLFAYYNESGANGTYYYNKLASLEVLVPNNYGSTDDLWKKIPKYYRELDATNSSYLYRYLSIFGFEIDKTRTLIDAVMTQYDPLLADSEAVAELANMVGLEVTDLGTTRTRALLHDIGYLRRSKGTIDSITGYLTAVSGGAVDVVTNASAPYYEFYVHSQRANLVANPRFVGDTNWSVASQNSVTVDSTAAYGISITCGASASLVAVRSNVGVPTSPTTPYYMSMEITGDYDSVYEPQWHTSASWSAWSTTTAKAGISLGSNRYAYEMEASDAKATRYPVFVIKLQAGQKVNLNYWMVEPNNFGSFFDGDSVFGGYLYQNQSSDYVWSGTVRNSYSTYTANRVPTQDAIDRLMPKILPVTLLGGVTPKYTVTYNAIPGVA